MPTAVRKLSWEDIKDLPETAGRTEIVDGELIVSPTPATRHQQVCTELGIELGLFVRNHDLGTFFSSPIHVILDEHVHYEPDLSFVAKACVSIIGEKYIEGPPDLIVEVISESNRTDDTVVKYEGYERYGVAEYWLVDPREEHIRVYSLQHGRFVPLGIFSAGDRVSSNVCAELQLDPANVLVKA